MFASLIEYPPHLGKICGGGSGSAVRWV